MRQWAHQVFCYVLCLSVQLQRRILRLPAHPVTEFDAGSHGSPYEATEEQEETHNSSDDLPADA